MKKLITIITFAVLVSSCKQENSNQKDNSPQQDHYYSFRDGNLYGYEQQKESDGTEKPLLMIQYAGQKDDTYQLFFLTPDNKAINVVECTKPCEFMKQMTFYNSTDENYISKQYYRVGDKSVIKFAILDAINGKLERSFAVRGGKTYEVWFGNKLKLSKTN